jgi:inner membrane protein
MDPITQGLLGAAVGHAVLGPKLGRRAAVWGGLVGMSPDLDIVLNATGPLGEFLWHRGPTHSLFFGPLVGPLVGWLLWRSGRERVGTLADWIWLSILALITHPLLDLFTTYGTQLLLPFSRQRFSLDAVSIIDPVYSLMLVVPLVVGWRRGWTGIAARRAAVLALAVSTAYLGLGMAFDAKARAIAGRAAMAAGITPLRVESHPTVLQPWLRRLVVQTGSGWGIGWVSLWTGETSPFQYFEEGRDPRIGVALATREGKVFTWFADGEMTATVRDEAPLSRVQLVDLRFGVPGDPRAGLFGLEIELDSRGRFTGVARRMRQIPANSGQGSSLLAELWRATFVRGGLARPTDASAVGSSLT